MEVVKAWFNKLERGNLIGFADVAFSLDGSDRYHMVIRGFKVFKGRDGNYIDVSVPARKDENGKKDERGQVKWYDTVVIYTNREEEVPGNLLMNSIRDKVEEEVRKVFDSKTKDVDDISDDDIPWG